MNTTRTILMLAAALAAAGTALAQQAPKPENLIKWRQSTFQVVAWNAGRIKAGLDGGYDKDQVLRSANAIAAIANSGLGSLFAPGTETGKGWHDTSVKPTLFSDASGAAAAQAAFGKEANELARVAQTGDVAAVKAQLAALQKTCKACHDDYRN